MTNRQAEYARTFADEAHICGHDLSYMDVLDILGGAGLALLPDETAQAVDAYLGSIVADP